MSVTKNPGRKASVRVELSRTDDLKSAYGYHNEAGFNFDLHLPDAVYNDEEAVQRIVSEIVVYFRQLLSTSADNTQALVGAPSAVAVPEEDVDEPLPF